MQNVNDSCAPEMLHRSSKSVELRCNLTQQQSKLQLNTLGSSFECFLFEPAKSSVFLFYRWLTFECSGHGNVSTSINPFVTISDFCLWFDVRTVLEQLLESILRLTDFNLQRIQAIKSTSTNRFKSDQSCQSLNSNDQRKTSISTQTPIHNTQRRHVKIQTRVITLTPPRSLLDNFTVFLEWSDFHGESKLWNIVELPIETKIDRWS